jgi:hypothetical protein
MNSSCADGATGLSEEHEFKSMQIKQRQKLIVDFMGIGYFIPLSF